MAELRKVGISTDVPPHKLKQGHGSEVCQVLINLVDLTLQKKGFQFLRPNRTPQPPLHLPPHGRRAVLCRPCCWLRPLFAAVAARCWAARSCLCPCTVTLSNQHALLSYRPREWCAPAC